MNSSCQIAFLSIFFLLVSIQLEAEAKREKTPINWIEEMSHSYRELDFDATYPVFLNGSVLSFSDAEPMASAFTAFVFLLNLLA